MTIRYARGPCYGDAFSSSDLLDPPAEGRGIGPPKTCNSGRLHNRIINIIAPVQVSLAASTKLCLRTYYQGDVDVCKKMHCV